MSMRGHLLSGEYNKMVWVRDDNGGEYVCYENDLKTPDRVTEEENNTAWIPVRCWVRTGKRLHHKTLGEQS